MTMTDKQATIAPEKRIMVKDLPRETRRALGQRGTRLNYMRRRTRRLTP